MSPLPQSPSSAQKGIGLLGIVLILLTSARTIYSFVKFFKSGVELTLIDRVWLIAGPLLVISLVINYVRVRRSIAVTHRRWSGDHQRPELRNNKES